MCSKLVGSTESVLEGMAEVAIRNMRPEPEIQGFQLADATARLKVVTLWTEITRTRTFLRPKFTRIPDLYPAFPGSKLDNLSFYGLS